MDSNSATCSFCGRVMQRRIACPWVWACLHMPAVWPVGCHLAPTGEPRTTLTTALHVPG